MKPSKNIGDVIGSLTITSRTGTSNDGRAIWECQCTCGRTRQATSKQLTRQTVRACEMCQDSGAKSPLVVRLRKWVEDENGCWIWTGKQNQDGYGSLIVDGKYTRAHRAMYFLHNPTHDKSLVVMHLCDNPSCVNPSHLKLGTQRENMLDMHRKKRFRGGAKPGNQNAKGNEGWKVGGIVKMLGRVPDELTK